MSVLRPCAALLLLGAGCDSIERLTLPPAPTADVAFGVLYDGPEPVRLGPVVAPGAIYAGTYAITGDTGGLEAKLAFFRTEDLVEAGQAYCAGRDSAIERSLCVTALSACSENPEQCLVVRRDVESCENRLPYPSGLEVVVLSGTSGELRSSSTTIDTLTGLRLCGPVTEPPCPNLLPSLLISDPAGYRCVAPTNQVGCRLQVDLAECGLPQATADISPTGELTFLNGACAREPADALPALGDGRAYAITCGSESVTATVMGEQLAELGCLRSGPATFETDISVAAEFVGRITGFAAIQPDGWPPRWAMTGFGVDSCGVFGCRRLGINCGIECEQGCDSFSFRYCARPAWSACAGFDRQQLCKERCQNFCQRAATSFEQCIAGAQSPMVTLSDPAAPEALGPRVNLADSLFGPLGDQALARLGPEDDPTLLAVGRSGVHVLRARPGSQDMTVTSTLALPHLLAGVAVNDSSGDVVVFGATDDGVGQWSRLTVNGAAVAVAAGPNPVPELSEANAGAASDGRVYLADTRAPAGRATPPLVAVDLDALTTETYALPGTVSALVPLPGRRALVAVVDSSGGRLIVAAPDRTMLTEVPTLAGLAPRALVADSDRCTPDECLVWVAYETTRRAGRAVLGRIIVRAQPETIDVPAALVPAPMDRIGILAVDTLNDSVVAISHRRNELTALRITLAR